MAQSLWTIHYAVKWRFKSKTAREATLAFHRVFKVSFLLPVSQTAEGNSRMKAKGLAKGAGLNDETSFRERKSGSVGEPDPVRFTGDILLVYEPSPWVTEPQHLNRPSIVSSTARRKIQSKEWGWQRKIARKGKRERNRKGEGKQAGKETRQIYCASWQNSFTHAILITPV